MKSRTRKLLIAGGAFFGSVLLLLVVVPLLFGDRIAERVKAQANRSLDARIDWSDADLGVLAHFPDITLRLDDLTVAGVGPFQRDTLAAIGQLRVVLDFASVVRSAIGGSAPMVVKAVELDRPRIRLLVLADGTANWNITKPPAGSSVGRLIEVSLKRLTIEGGRVNFDNRAAKVLASLANVGGTLSGDFSREQVDVESRVHVDTATVDFAGITYLNGVRLDLSANLGADMVRKVFTLREGTGLRINELPLAAAGTVTQRGNVLGVDVRFGAPRAEFREILSLVPAVYAKDFGSVRTSGTLALSGLVRGDYGDNAFPAFNLNAKVTGGAFQYPDLPLPARDIALDLAVTNPGGSADSTVVNVSRLHLVLGRNPVDAQMVLRTPISDPDIDARLRGTVDLTDLRRTVKLDRVQELAGTVSADAAVRTRMSSVDQERYERVTASGTVVLRNVSVKSEALTRPLAIREATLALAPRRAELRSFSGTVGSSDLNATGSLDNLLGYLLRDDDLRGSATLASNRFVLDEWRTGEGELSVIPVPRGVDFAIDATVRQLLYDGLEMENARGRLRVKDRRITLEDFSLATLGGAVSVDGYYETTVPAKPTFDVGLRMYRIDIPSAFTKLTTVQRLAPIALYAQGNFTAGLRLTGPLSRNMMPLVEALTGQGNLETSQLVIRDFPGLEKIAARTKLAFLSDPTLRALQSQFEITDGRFRVRPFTVQMGDALMDVNGSNGFDQSIDYALNIRVPRALIGPAANQALAGLSSRAAAAGVNLHAAPEIAVAARLTGKVNDPAVSVDVGRVAAGAAQVAGQAVQEAAEQRVTAVADSARARIDTAAQRLVQEAEARAGQIRAEARALAERVKTEGNQRADSLAARGGDNPLARAAATAAADRLRKEADANALRITREGDARADSLVFAARRRAGTEQ